MKVNEKEVFIIKASKKIELLVEWGAKPYRIAKVTGVNENTVRRAFNEVDKISKLKLENAEKIASYYDTQVVSLINAIVTLEELFLLMEPNSERLTLDPTFTSRLKSNPFEVFKNLHLSVSNNQRKLRNFEEHQIIFNEYIAAMDFGVAEKIILPDNYLYLMNIQRTHFSKIGK